MKHLIIFAIILLGMVLLKMSNQCQIEKMTNTNLSLYLKTSELGGKYGRGVFTNKDFEIGEIIELAPYIEDETDNFKGIIRDYIFSKNGKLERSVVAFGFGSMYNHSDSPNARWEVTNQNVKIQCIKPIKKDEEVFITYGNEYWKTRNNLEKKS
jgi:hypothetical protein